MNISPALTASLFALPVGIALFAPFVAIRYRREGRLSAMRLLQWGALLLYGMALWTYTLLPLPIPGTYECLPAQLNPLQFLSDITKYPHGSPGELLRNPAAAQIALNVALFLPLGSFLRLIWRRGVAASVVAGFLVSLAIELTQLTGLWGVTACAYRLFDVDDLLANTIGAALGGLFSILLRTRRNTTSAVPFAPARITLPRRIVGILCDLTVLLCAGAAARVLLVAWWLYVDAPDDDASTLDAYSDLVAALVPVALFAALVLITGRTVGDHATLIRWDGGPRSVLLARALRLLGSAGPWMLAAYYLYPIVALLLALTAVVALVARRDRAGIPGLLARLHPVDARPAAVPPHLGERRVDSHTS
ncbi:hypothetical protein C5C27_04365 [Rathayibacter sp. AY2B7]|uniref:VanZ family protein n=1 Tax=Rathayibacter sp. AY2B7 TaxID=2080571 RepID=UPI000CE754F5|nr:VanZ family protein [Rathayibacter sp. AY2B7]PPG64123.1 hypothetical protein C5C27_04365 [Rathayibacter sp. AY2B7]